VVRRRQVLRLAETAPVPAWRWALAAAVLPVGLAAAGAAAGALDTPALVLAGAVLGAAMVPLAAGGRLLATAGVAVGWFAGHALATAWLADQGTPAAFAVPGPLVAGVAVALAGLFALQAAIVLRPRSAAVRALYPWAYGGFYVDERVSRLLLRAFPAPQPAAQAPTLSGAR